jgi:hypothetical protein
MIQLALAELGEVLAVYPVEGSHEPITASKRRSRRKNRRSRFGRSATSPRLR